MANLNDIFGGSFDSQSVEPAGDFEAIPAGWQTVEITRTGIVVTKAGTGRFIEVEFTILDGPHKNHKLWERYNVDNPSEKTRKIAAGQFSSLCRAVNAGCLDDTDELLQQMLQVRVAVKGDYNEIKGYKALGVEQQQAPPQQQQAPPQQQQQPSGSQECAQQPQPGVKPPWMS